MRIIFFGASDLGWECCNSLLLAREQIVGIVTIPQTFSISWSDMPVVNSRYRSFHDLAETHCLPLLSIEKRMKDPAYLETVRSWNPDLILVIGWYYMVSSAYRNLAAHGAIGLHASLLPKYRGGAPLVWAVINGERESGVSLFQLEDGVDTGGILGQARFPIEETDDISDVVGKATRSSVKLVQHCIPRLREGKASFVPQNEAEATIMPQRKPEDGWLDWSRLSLPDAYNWIRAQSRPYPGAFSRLDGAKMTIWRSQKTDRITACEPGYLFVDGGQLFATCADRRALRLLDISMEGGDSEDFASVLQRVVNGGARLA